ncbi:MAG TPA: hypothetical protein VFU05_13610 [Cyclobacteriaceae bacterium]|nr:hypothetical protein [Cyclobacteriaceae bacterium]
MIPILINAFRLAGSAAIGYFANDVASGVQKLLPASTQQKTVDSSGRPAWWFMAIILLLLGGVFFIIFKMIFGKKAKTAFSIILVGGVCYAIDCYMGIDSSAMLATALVTLTTGAGVLTSANLSFLPERIEYVAATQLTGVKVTVQGDGVVFDSDANGLTHIGVNRVIGQLTNSYVLTLADGVFKNKNVLFEFTNSAAQTPIVYYDSDSSAPIGQLPLFLQMMKVPLLVGGNDFTDFATLSLPSLAAGDSITVLYQDGTVQANMNRQDLQYRLGYTQNIVNTPIYQIDNYNKMIKSVTVNCLAAQTGYMQRWAPSLKGTAVKGQE